MNMNAAPLDIAHGDIDNLEDLIDRESLREVCHSFYELFGLSIRVFSHKGALLANVHEERNLCRQVNGVAEGKRGCMRTVSTAQGLVPEGGETIEHACFTGAVYRVVPIIYDERQLGRIILGPFVPEDLVKPPASLLQVLPDLDQAELQAALTDMPVVGPATADRIANHLRGVLDLILFSGHRAHLTSAMHLATVRENFRELAEKNASLQDAFDKLQELDRLKSNFLATISHELRTPLTSIIGYTEMLVAGIGGDLNPEQRGFVETIRTKGDLLLTLITSLLDLNKLERGKLSIEPESVDPKGVLDEIQETCLPAAGKKGIALVVNCGDDLSPIQADPIRIRQILLNLAGNAVKFTPNGGQVTLSAHRTELVSDNDSDEEGGFGAALMMAPEPAVEFVVEDTGIGMADNELDQVFGAFYQVDGSSTREYEGAGLGLSIAKTLTEAHGGRIRVESEQHRGTRFFVVLPEAPHMQDD